MIYEIQTTALQPGMMAEVLARTAERLPAREAVSPLSAYWQTEVGALNRTIGVWAYRDLAHLGEVRTALAGVEAWPPDIADISASEQVEIVTPAPFMRPLEPGNYGGVFEMRTYTFRPGTMPHVLRIWEKAIAARERLSPLVACWYTEIGALNRFTHIWAYKSLDERALIRADAVRQGIWPPMTREWRLSEESSILLPAPFSPVR